MDYRFLMLTDPNEIKRILDEFGGRSDVPVDHQMEWISKLITRLLTLNSANDTKRINMHHAEDDLRTLIRK